MPRGFSLPGARPRNFLARHPFYSWRMTEESFRRAVAEHKDRVFGYAVRLLGDREEARDVAQEALVRLWQHRGRVDEGAARPWLLRTTHNLGLDRIRRRTFRNETRFERIGPVLRDGTPSPERAAAAELIRKAIADALDALSPRDRAIVILREVQGLAYEEIAEVLGVPLGTLKAALHRSREKLREALVTEGIVP